MSGTTGPSVALPPCPHLVSTNLRCDGCGEFVGVPPPDSDRETGR